MTPRKNVIVLTSGQSGSSVLTALIARAGYWVGEETKKVAYDTFENSALVDLNLSILRAAGYAWHDMGDLPAPSAPAVRSCIEGLDPSPAREFVAECERHRPWIWKDPRLCFTMHYWEAFVDVSHCQFVVMGRDLRQAWTGSIVKSAEPMSFGEFTRVHGGCMRAAEDFLRERDLPFLCTTFEDVMLRPSQVLDDLNAFLGLDFTLDDLREIYRGPLGVRRWSVVDHVHAWLRYQAHRWLRRDTVRFPRAEHEGSVAATDGSQCQASGGRRS